MAADDGVTGGLEVSRPMAMVLASFLALSWVGSVEITILVFTTFRKYSGLYFWSFLASSLGIFIYALGFLFKFFRVVKYDYLSVTLITLGWYGMVTGQALVLYSRLHLVVRNQTTIKWVLRMIIANVFLLHVPTTVLTFGANSAHASVFRRPYTIMEKIQVTGFGLQEVIISIIYIQNTMKCFQPGFIHKESTIKKMVRHLIAVNVFVILLDLVTISLEYANLYHIQITFKGVVYVFKLKLEYTILTDLVSTIHTNHSSSGVRSYGNPACTGEQAAPQIIFKDSSKGDQNCPRYFAEVQAGGPPIPLHDRQIVKTTKISIYGEIESDSQHLEQALSSAPSTASSQIHLAV